MKNTTNAAARRNACFLVNISEYWERIEYLVGTYDIGHRMDPKHKDYVKYGMLQLLMDSLPAPRFTCIEAETYSKRYLRTYFSTGCINDVMEDMAYELITHICNLSDYVLFSHPVFYKLLDETNLMIAIDKRDLEDDTPRYNETVEEHLRGLSGDISGDRVETVRRANRTWAQ